MSEQTNQEPKSQSSPQEPKDPYAKYEREDLIEMLESAKDHISHLKGQLSGMESKDQGFIIITPELKDPDGNPMPRYSGVTAGVKFRNGVGFLSIEELEMRPPKELTPEQKVQRIVSDYEGYEYQKGSAAQALSMMGGMEAVQRQSQGQETPQRIMTP